MAFDVEKKRERERGALFLAFPTLVDTWVTGLKLKFAF